VVTDLESLGERGMFRVRLVKVAIYDDVVDRPTLT
jgi:hypothetical protein